MKISLKLPEGYTGVRPVAEDHVMLKSANWIVCGKVSSCAGFKNVKVQIVAKPNSDPPPPECNDYTLSYVINDYNYKKMKESVKKISEAGEGGSAVASVILGEPIQSLKKKFTIRDTGRLDESQAEAVQTAIDNRVSLIVGPYGCGKTTVIGSIISNLINNSEDIKVLAVAPSNQATNHLTEALARVGLKVLRIVAKSHEAKIDSSMPISKHCLHIKLKQIEADGLTPSEKNKLEEEETSKALKEASIILTTCSAARMNAVKSIGRFSAIIMDEACQVKDIFFGVLIQQFISRPQKLSPSYQFLLKLRSWYLLGTPVRYLNIFKHCI